MKRYFSISLITAAMVSFFLFQAQVSFSAVVDQNDNNLLARAAQLQKNYSDSDALQIYEQVLQKEPDNFQALLNAAFLHLRQGWLNNDEKVKKEQYLKLRDYADRALKLKPSDYQAQLVDIIAKGKTAGYLPIGDQVGIVWELKKGLDSLMTSRSDDPDSIYVLSWLNFKVGQINDMQKFFASLLFGGLPEDLTTANAITLMQKAIALRPDYNVYKYDLGLFYQRTGQVAKAKELFTKVLSSSPQKPEERMYSNLAKKKIHELDLRTLAKN